MSEGFELASSNQAINDSGDRMGQSQDEPAVVSESFGSSLQVTVERSAVNVMSTDMAEPDREGRPRRIDYVLVSVQDPQQDALTDLSEDQKELLDYRKLYLRNLRRRGLQMEVDQEGEQKFTKIHAPNYTLFKYAEIMKMKMPLKRNDTDIPEGLSAKIYDKMKFFKPPTFPEDDDTIEHLGKVPEV